MPTDRFVVPVALFISILFFNISVEAQPPTLPIAPTQEIAKPVPNNATWVPFGGRDTPVRESGTPEYQYFDTPTRVARLSEFLKAESSDGNLCAQVQ